MTAAGGDRYEVVTTGEDFRALEAEWNDLARRAPGHYSTQGFAWCWSNWEALAGPRGARLHCLVLREDGRAVLIWPWIVERRFLWSCAVPLSFLTFEYLDLLVEAGADSERRIAEAWAILPKSLRADIVFLPHLRADSPLSPIVARTPRAEIVKTETSCSVAPGGFASWESYMRSRDGEERRDLNRRRRRLAEAGAIASEPLVAGAQRDRILDWILRQKLEWIGRRNEPYVWPAIEAYRRMLSAVGARSPDSLAISALRLDGRPIAGMLACLDDQHMRGLITVYDPEYRKFAPGQILYEDCIRWAFERGLEYDCGIGVSTYKRQWRNAECVSTTYYLAVTAWGSAFIPAQKAALQAERAKDRIKLVMPQGWRQAIKRLLKPLGS